MINSFVELNMFCQNIENENKEHEEFIKKIKLVEIKKLLDDKKYNLLFIFQVLFSCGRHDDIINLINDGYNNFHPDTLSFFFSCGNLNIIKHMVDSGVKITETALRSMLGDMAFYEYCEEGNSDYKFSDFSKKNILVNYPILLKYLLSKKECPTITFEKYNKHLQKIYEKYI